MTNYQPHTVDLDSNEDCWWSECDMGDTVEDSTGNIAVTGTGTNIDWESEVITAAGNAGGGVGTWTGEVWIGKYFDTIGSSERDVELKFTGWHEGFLLAGGNSSAEAEITGELINMDTGASVQTLINSWWVNRLWTHIINDNYEDTLQTRLYPNTDYKMIIRLRAHINVAGLGQTSADFGPQDGDDKGERVSWDEMELKKL